MFLLYSAAVENIYIDKDDPEHEEKRCLYIGAMFIKHTIVIEDNVVSIYKKGDVFFKQRKEKYFIESFPVVSEYTPIDEFPDKFAIRTENIELLRELIARGKKITWITPDIIKFISSVVSLPFENLFIDPFIGEYAILPTGEARTVKMLPSDTQKKDYDFSRIRRVPVVFSKTIGFHPIDFLDRVDFNRVLRTLKYDFARKGKHLDYINNYLILAYYNILSITYMICKKSCTAMIAKKENVNKD